MVMKIESYTPSTDTFTFPHNSRVLDDQLTPFIDKKEFPYAFAYVGLTDQIKGQRSVILTGHTDGTNKFSDFRNIAKHFSEPKIKKLYFSTDKFYLGVGGGAKNTNSGGRTNFVDYVASFYSPFGILFDDTQQSDVFNGASSNDGDAFTPIEQIEGAVTSGQTVSISDSDGNGFTFVASASGGFIYNIVRLEDLGGGNKFLSFITGSIGGVKQKLKIANNDKSMILGLDAAQSLSDLSITESNITGTYKFRNGWSGN